MANKRKRTGKGDSSMNSTGEPENSSSQEASETARPWTDEEMAAAKPLPLPSVESVPVAPTRGVPYSGKGDAKPGGKPEDSDKAKG
jgi:hypothetical protein